MKLLTALCDALGLDVEEAQDQSISSGQVLVPHQYKLTKSGRIFGEKKKPKKDKKK